MSNSEIKEVKSLQQKKFRDQSGLFVVEGEKMVAESLNSDFEVVKVYRKDDIGEAAMSRISGLSSPSPVLAVVKQKTTTDASAKIIFDPQGLCLALDAIRDPGNLGTILRISDWFGVDAIFASHDTAEVYNPKVVQASMGAIFRKSVIYCNLPELCQQAKDAGVAVFGTFLGGEDIYATELPQRALVVMGNEANGVSDAVAAQVDTRLTIPSFGGGAESLNVAIATAITVSEFARRWK